MAQIDEPQWFAELSEGGNSIAHLIKHIAGNMRSRWTDFLTSDGEKPDRNRDKEFEIGPGDTARSLRDKWDEAWSCLFSTLEALTPADLDRTILIRGESHCVVEAINRQMAHYSMHVGQIILIAKTLRGEHWRTFSTGGKGSGWSKGMLKRP